MLRIAALSTVFGLAADIAYALSYAAGLFFLQGDWALGIAYVLLSLVWGAAAGVKMLALLDAP